ncbi:hypothetical protein [Aureispira sp. CCB-QB1]|uniref:hypothetical protein n=1 Tax=Aureispira sp. CCB-QB1 TaxID=1313421 RepID=UPI0006972022|nr:hypothetical protein [Aureispira sp. CCB-QB1]
MKYTVLIVVTFCFFSCMRTINNPVKTKRNEPPKWQIRFLQGFSNDEITCEVNGKKIFDKVKLKTEGGEDTFAYIKFFKSDKNIEISNSYHSYVNSNLVLNETFDICVKVNQYDTCFSLNTRANVFFGIGLDDEKKPYLEGAPFVQSYE